MHKRTRKLLIKARDLLINKGWCQWSTCVDKDGNRSEFKDAVAFCASGALSASMPFFFGYEALNEAQILMRDQIENLGYYGIVSYNDYPTTTKEDIINLFNKVINEN